MYKLQMRWLMPTIFASLFLLSVHAFAQEGPPPDGPPPDGPPPGMQQESPNEAAAHELKQLSKRLKLTEDQKTSIRPILIDRHERMSALFSDRSGPIDAKREQMDKIRESSNQSIRDLLNEQQKGEFDKLVEKGGYRPQGPPE